MLKTKKQTMKEIEKKQNKNIRYFETENKNSF